MGFFDSITAAKNYITGGSAELTVKLPETVQINEPFQVGISCKALADVQLDKVYIVIQSVEKVHVEKYDLSEKRTKKITDTSTLFEKQFDIAGEHMISKGEVVEWESSITIPKKVQCTYKGENASHEWRLYAAIDVPGKDPESPWISFEAYF